MISASKNTLSLNYFKIWRPKVGKILWICLRSFVNFHPGRWWKRNKTVWNPSYSHRHWLTCVLKRQKVRHQDLRVIFSGNGQFQRRSFINWKNRSIITKCVTSCDGDLDKLILVQFGYNDLVLSLRPQKWH